jgi:NDP-sugar pyrophosphorylase family protein
MLNIVIPMAGLGSRFAQQGYDLPKPLIPVLGVPMIRLVIANIAPARPHRFVFICQKKHVEAYRLRGELLDWAPGSVVIEIDGLTEGAACTVLCARDAIQSDDPMMIANSDQYVEVDIDDYLAAQDQPGVDGLIMTMRADDPKWSFAELDAKGDVRRVVEKQVISPHATVGIYNFKKGSDFVRAADEMIARNDRVNGEFYVAPVYNELAGWGRRIRTYEIGSEGQGMHGLGIPSDLEKFLASPVSERATAGLR